MEIFMMVNGKTIKEIIYDKGILTGYWEKDLKEGKGKIDYKNDEILK